VIDLAVAAIVLDQLRFEPVKVMILGKVLRTDKHFEQSRVYEPEIFAIFKWHDYQSLIIIGLSYRHG
jgi:hypothetical protein